MKKTLLFAALVLLQLGIPFAMIAKYEAVLAFGEEYKFRCAPVDPVNPLCGRYVALNFDAKGFDHDDGNTRWALLAVDKDGFAYAKTTSDKKPASGPCLKYNANWNRPQFSFSQYFMNEKAAPEAENAYRQSVRRDAEGKADSYLVVKIWHGQAVGSQLFVNGKRIEELVGACAKTP